MAVYWQLHGLLADRGMTRYDLAKLTRLNLNTIYPIGEKDSPVGRVDGRTLDRLCQVLDVQPGELLRYVPGKPGVTVRTKQTQKRRGKKS
jgi:DNA-binding Xre family transcriptional regulator